MESTGDRSRLSDEAASPPEGRRPFVLVTGASRGIGEATALALGERGWHVGVHYGHGRDAAEHVVARIVAAGGQARAYAADLADDGQIQAMFGAIDDDVGHVDALVNNAGIVAPKSDVAGMDAARITRLFAVNVVGAFGCAREAVRRMAPPRGRGGAIVNVSSVAARLGSPGEYVDYAASKGAIDTMTVGLAREVATQGIRVNAVRPGLIETTIHASGGQPDRLARLRTAIPMQRAGRAREVADAICWLLGDDASYVTGALLDVGGGR